MKGYIYITTNLINGKKYIGQKRGNFNPSYKGSGIKLKSAFKKYGKSAFDSVLLEEVEISELNEKEIFWINHYNAVIDDNFYNLSSGGKSWGSPRSKETREKIRQKALGRPAWNKGKQNLIASERMKNNNPMKNPEVVKKVQLKLKGKLSSNKILDNFKWNCKECKKEYEEYNTAHNRLHQFCNKSCSASYSNKHRYKHKEIV
jgi:group I intron endonuclease